MNRAPQTLVVDDHAVNLRYLEALMQREGHSVHCAVNGQQAVDAARSQVFDLVLMDLHMPVMDGETAIRHVRTLPDPHSGPLIIVVTADIATSARDRVFAAGADGFLEKPIEPQALRLAIARGRRQGGAPLTLDSRTLTTAPSPVASGVPSAGSQALDANRLAELRAAIPEESLRKLLVEVLESPQSGLPALLSALQRNEVGLAAAAAHRLKGTCMMMGLRLLQEEAAQAEKQMRGVPPPSHEAMQDLAESLREKAALTWAALQQG